MKNLKTILVLAMALFASSCTAQNKEKSKAELALLAENQALQIAKEFTEALYHGDYEKAKGYGDEEAVERILNACRKNDEDEENLCELDSAFVFKKLHINSQSNQNSTFTRYRIYFEWNEKFIDMDVDRTNNLNGINYQVSRYFSNPSDYAKDLSKLNQYKY